MYALIFKSISYSITSVSIHILILDTKKRIHVYTNESELIIIYEHGYVTTITCTII